MSFNFNDMVTSFIARSLLMELKKKINIILHRNRDSPLDTAVHRVPDRGNSDRSY